jgi:hypothetical protein
MDRRSFLCGLVGGAAGGYAMSFLLNPYIFDTSAAPQNYFANTGATSPWYGAATYPPALYDSASDTTWFSWEAWTGTTRVARVTSLDHATGYWSDIIEAGFSSLVDDDHGNPALCLDDEGYLHCFHGSHNTDQLHSSTRWDVTGSPGSGSLWAIRSPIAGEYAYPHPVAIGTNIHLLLRKRITASTKMPLVVRSTSALVAGEATWGSEVTLVDLDTDSRFYMGQAYAVGTDIHIIATRANYTDTVREHVYYFVYKTATGAVTNHDGSTSVASGSLPVTLAQANANFRLFTHSGGNDEGGIPVLCFDSSGDPHVAFKDGTGTSYAVKHIKRTAGVWDSPVSVATGDNRFTPLSLVPLSAGAVELYYTLDPSTDWDVGGDVTRRTRDSGGTWSAADTILTASSSALGGLSAVLNGDVEARVVFCERAEGSTDAEAGNLKTYVYGSSGLIAYEQEPAASAPAGETLQLNGENLQLNGEDLTLG